MAKKTPTKRARAKAPAPAPAAITRQDPEPSLTAGSALPVVGMGASAGGLEAFTAVLRSLPADTGMAFVLVQHLDPKHDSMLVDLLAKSTGMPVMQARNGEAVVANHVYVIPPNTNLEIASSVLRITQRAPGPGVNMPVDCFFRSLAQDSGERAIAVILSGTSSDGALGIEAVKGAGGITLAQDVTAKYDGMPRSAIATGCVDFVLPPDGIARELARIANHPYVRSTQRVPELQGAEGDVWAAPLSRIYGLLRLATSVDFTHYKATTIRRRIARRMTVHRLEKLDDYVALLERNTTEVEALYREVLINVTSFFRDPDMFNVLKHKFLPDIISRLPPESPVRIWVAGCATGEEAYSLAIAALEHLRERKLNLPLQVFATDISESALEKARAAVYLENIALDVSPARLRQFFVKHDGGYQVNKSVRDLCVFARQNVAKDPPFSKMDLISCRNVLIYLDVPLQKRIIPMFHYALKPHGVLLLGSSESIGVFSDMFDVSDKNHRIFTKRQIATAQRFDFEPGTFMPSPADPAVRGSRRPDEAVSPDLQKEADRLVLSEYGPPGVIINDDLEVVQFRGRTSPYLEPAPGKASLNLLKMLREGLLLEVRNAVQKVKRTGETVRKRAVPTKQSQGFHNVDVEVMRLQETSHGRHYLVLFRQSEVPVGAPKESRGKAAELRQVKQVQEELIATRHYLQSIIEEQGATNEELQSANEELQSTNEELTTVNEELQNRNLELSRTNDDLNNLLASVNMAIVMLSSDLRIRRFTPTAGRILNIIPTDIGRPITDLRPVIHVPDLGELIGEVLDSVTGQSRDVSDTEGRNYSMSIRPYRTSDNRIDGAVLTLLDTEAIRRGFDPSRSYREFIQTAIDMVDDPMAVVDLDFQVRYANQSFRELFDGAAGEHGRPFALDPNVRSVIEPIASGARDGDGVHEVKLSDGKQKVAIHVHPFPAPGGTEMLVVRLAKT
jgi:two-component system, chemotaxis family, CheB/CheR fusion protein